MKFPVKLLFLVLVLGVWGCPNSMDEQTAVSVASATEEKQAEAVRVMEIQLQTISRNVTYTTTLIPFEEVNLAPATPGKIERIEVEVGAKVTRGQVLVRMDQTQLHQAQTQLQNLAADLQRLETLKKSGSATVQQYDQVKTQYEVASASYDSLKENAQLLAPFSGIITGRYYENGEMFSGAPNTPTGKAAIVSIAAIRNMKAKVAVSERYYPYISKKTPLQMTTEVYGVEIFSGSVLRVYPSIDPMTRTFIVEVKIPNKTRRLHPGMAARVSLTLNRIEALMVPASAILKLRGSNERFIFLEQVGRAKRVVVEIVMRHNDLVEIVSEAVHPGDHLIVAGQSRLLDGDTVAVQN